MNIANLSPAERIKAFGLVGLIIVALFFVVHTMLGAVSPKKKQNTDPNTAAQATAAPGAPAPAGGAPSPALQSPGSVEEAFPVDKAVASAKKTGDSDRNVPDPFIQLRDPDDPSSRLAFAHNAKRQAEPIVEIQPNPYPRGGLPPLGGVPFNGAGGGPTGPAAVIVPEIEPEIRVIGLVHGEKTVATLQVGGQIQIARPGDALAKGYRLMQVTPESIVIRHKGEYSTLRVGASMNTPAQKL